MSGDEMQGFSVTHFGMSTPIEDRSTVVAMKLGVLGALEVGDHRRAAH